MVGCRSTSFDWYDKYTDERLSHRWMATTGKIRTPAVQPLPPGVRP